MGDGGSYVIVTVETNDLFFTTGLAEAAEQAGNIMTSAGIAADWNVSRRALPGAWRCRSGTEADGADA